MSGIADRLFQRQQRFKKGIDAVDARRKREDAAVQLRKQTHDEALLKKRMVKERPAGQLPVAGLSAGAGEVAMRTSAASGVAMEQPRSSCRCSSRFG